METLGNHLKTSTDYVFSLNTCSSHESTNNLYQSNTISCFVSTLGVHKTHMAILLTRKLFNQFHVFKHVKIKKNMCPPTSFVGIHRISYPQSQTTLYNHHYPPYPLPPYYHYHKHRLKLSHLIAPQCYIFVVIRWWAQLRCPMHDLAAKQSRAQTFMSPGFPSTWLR